MKVALLFLLLLVPFYTNATDSLSQILERHKGITVKKAPKKEDFRKRKCIEGGTKITEKLTYKEICKYSSKGCPNTQANSKIMMYCQENNLSECFENKSWLTKNQLVGLPENIDIGYMTRGLSVIKGAMTDKTCAYYEKK